MTTHFLRFCRAGSVNGMAFAGGVSGVGCAIGRIYTGFRSREGTSGSGLFVALAVDFWGFYISSFPLPSSVSIREVSSF